MLLAVEIILKYRGNQETITKLVSKLNSYNFNAVDFTVHLEDSSARLRLMPNKNDFEFDETLGIENYTNMIIKILERNEIEYNIIQTMEMPSEKGNGTLVE